MASPFLSLLAVIPAAFSIFFVYWHRRTYGSLPIHTADVAYKRHQYHDVLDWDKYALSIESNPTMIFSGEFHYWRLPDRTRWEQILKRYKSAGLNTIRIYFHWGYHSPAQDTYHFDGNRDIEYLLSLCERLGIYVLAAPGPYICAETNGGGYPAWLVAKRHLRIRHNMAMLWRSYDSEFAMHEVDWYHQLLPIIARHQITSNNAEGASSKGCVIGVQIDNELFEVMHGLLPVGLHDQMRILAQAARDAGITVPLFTNDGFEEGGWIPRTTFARTGMPHRDQSKGFGIDWYGFDKYVVFAPSSSPKSWLIDDGQGVGEWADWDPRTVKNSVDNLEKTVRGFGGGAAETPMFIPELQGGWFNHYLLNHTYDEIYDFFGENYTKLILDSMLAQGITMNSIYMFYGGTNWGMVGDPDVYTSYDYSACIREYGYMSSRLRAVKQTVLFARSFGIYFAKTDRVKQPDVSVSIPDVLNTQRETAAGHANQQVKFSFLRNFDKKKRDTFQVETQYTTQHQANVTLALGCQLPYKQTMTAVGNYIAANGAKLILSTLPIVTRIVSDDAATEIWVVAGNPIGEMAFDNEGKDLEFSGNMHHSVREQATAVVVGFGDVQGWTKVTKAGKDLYIISLSASDVSTLFAEFHDPYWYKADARSQPIVLTWGADSAFYNRQDRTLEINHNDNESEVHIVTFEKLQNSDLSTDDGKYNLPFIRKKVFAPTNQASKKEEETLQIPLTNWAYRSTDLASLPWSSLVPSGKDKATFEALDHLYTSGHVLYRTTFRADKDVTLSVNARNRATIILNGKIVGGHTTYSRQLFMPGAKIGPDPYFLGSKKYPLPTALLSSNGTNELVVVVDSFGLCRQAFIMNDIRNPRGVISATLSGLDAQAKKDAEDGWQITGIDVRQLYNQYDTTGWPDERSQVETWEPLNVVEELTTHPVTTFKVFATDGPRWVRFTFDFKRGSDIQFPLRMHLDGAFTAIIILNDVVVGRYYGNGDGPQHDFYLMDGLVKTEANNVEMLVYAWDNVDDAQVFISGWPIQPGSGNLAKPFGKKLPDWKVHSTTLTL